MVRNLPVLTLLLFYSVVMSFEYGLPEGVQLALISFSFFIICTPISSQLYLFGLLPFAPNSNAKGSLIRTFIFWIFFLLVNLVSMYFSPNVYKKAFFPSIVYSLLKSWPTNIAVLSVSSAFLIYQWLVYFVRVPVIKAMLQIFGFFASLGFFYIVFQVYKPAMIHYFIDMSYSNY